MNKAKMTNIILPKPQINSKNPQKGFPIPREEIEKLRKTSNDKLVFSFKFLDYKHKAFNLGNTEATWFKSLLEILKEVSDLTRNQLMVEKINFYHAHCHDWSKTQYKFDFNDDFLEQVECLQFRLSKSKGRVHGFIVGNRFYIVWLDPHHNLYPSEHHGGLKLYEYLPTCYEQLLEKHNQLMEQYERLEREHMKLLEQCTKP